MRLTGQTFPPLPALQKAKKWKQLLGKVKVWKLTSYGLPPSDFSTSRGRRRWYPAGWLRVSPSGPRLWPPSRTGRRETAVPSWRGCWSGRRPSEQRASPWWRWASFCLSCLDSWLHPSQDDCPLKVGGFWRAEVVLLIRGRSKPSLGSSPQLITGLWLSLHLKRFHPPVSRETCLLNLFLPSDHHREKN